MVTLLFLLSAGCYSSVPTETERGCNFTYRDALHEGSASCTIPDSSTASCFDAALCICEAWNPDATAAEIQACAEAETIPRAMITLADFCNEYTDLTLGEALRGWAEVFDGQVTTDDGCEDIPASLENF